MHLVKHICIYNSPMVKLYVQINASISMKYTTSCKEIESTICINYGAGFTFDNFACTFLTKTLCLINTLKL